MPLSLETLKGISKLVKLKGRGLILERHYEVLKKHVEDGNRLTEEHWESIDTLWELREIGAFSEEKWTEEIDGQVTKIIHGARPSPSSQQAAGAQGTTSTSSTEKRRQPAAAGSQAAKRGKASSVRAVKNTLGGNIVNAFAIGSGKPVSPSILYTHITCAVAAVQYVYKKCDSSTAVRVGKLKILNFYRNFDCSQPKRAAAVLTSFTFCTHSRKKRPQRFTSPTFLDKTSTRPTFFS